MSSGAEHASPVRSACCGCSEPRNVRVVNEDVGRLASKRAATRSSITSLRDLPNRNHQSDQTRNHRSATVELRRWTSARSSTTLEAFVRFGVIQVQMMCQSSRNHTTLSGTRCLSPSTLVHGLGFVRFLTTQPAVFGGVRHIRARMLMPLHRTTPFHQSSSKTVNDCSASHQCAMSAETFQHLGRSSTMAPAERRLAATRCRYVQVGCM